jgi:cyanophycinase-like exopeptidase
MPQTNIFRWRDGIGWLVLSGGGALESDDNLSIAAAMLSHTVSQGPVAYIWAASDVESADYHMDVLRDLGARTGYLIDILTEEDDDLFRQINEAGVIILGDGPRQETLRDALVGTALRGIEEAFRRGATLYGVGASAALIGAYAVDGEALVPGFSWLAHSIVLPGYTPDRAERLRGCVQQIENGYGLGLGQGAALALGPLGEVEVWGNKSITVSLGQNYS